MRVLLTGGNGFVGSRILRRLRDAKIPTVVLLRPSSSRRLIEHLLDESDVRLGTLAEPSALRKALAGVSHILHCAGKTKTLHTSEFTAVNVEGTRRLAQAANDAGVRRFTLISSLAASHPAQREAPARETDPSAPVSAYGRSKLAGEQALLQEAKMETVILRPAGVYGPGDTDFFQLFKAVQSGWCPQFGGGRQPLSLVYADDVAHVAVASLDHPGASGKTFHVAHPEILTAGELTQQVARCLQLHPRILPLPVAALLPLSWGGELVSRLTGRPGILGIDRRRELMAPGWVCDSSRLRDELGLTCTTSIVSGVEQTAAWYRESGWLAPRRSREK